jgi:ABC-type Na+ efflux pump permease subunit
VLRSLFTKTLWDQRRSLLAWALGIAAVAAMYSSAYPSARQRSAETVSSLPPAFRQAFGFGQIVSPAGYLEATVFNFIVPVLLILFVTAGARAIAGDEEAGTLDLLLAHPVGCTRLVLHRFAALAVATLALGMAVLLGLLAIAGPAQLYIPAVNFVAMALHLVLLVYYAVAVFVAFLSGLVVMARYSLAERSWSLLIVNLAGAGAVTFTLGVNLSRVYPLASLVAAVGVSAGMYGLWVRAGRPRGIAGPLIDAEASPPEPVALDRAASDSTT